MEQSERQKKIAATYNQTASHYDDILKVRAWWAHIIAQLVWGKNVIGVGYEEGILSNIPDDFNGNLLDIPCGTAVFTGAKYERMKNAKIICMDYSTEMLRQAGENLAPRNLQNITLRQGDIGCLPFPDAHFGILLSMHSFHAFPDKEAAWREAERVLAPGGLFCGCVYVKGQNARTDFFIRHVYDRRGYFTPPHETAESLRARLEKFADIESFQLAGSIACFSCKKRDFK